MKRVVITRTCAGQWLYTVYLDERVIIIGLSMTRDGAESQARMV